MSIAIAYLVIGLAMATGLILDRWRLIRVPVFGWKDLVAISACAFVVTIGWPWFIRKENMHD